MALSGDAPIDADDIQVQVTSSATTAQAAGQLGDQLESVERDAILQALEENRYNKTATARELGLTLRALRYRMQKLGID